MHKEPKDPHHFSPRAHHPLPHPQYTGNIDVQPAQTEPRGVEEHETAAPIPGRPSFVKSGPQADGTDIEMQGHNAYARGGRVHEAPHGESQENPLEEATETRQQESAESLKEAKPPFGRHWK